MTGTPWLSAAPLVGVVVPMYNAERTIGETLACVCDQTYRSLDIVVVDDGSTDGSAAIVAGFAARDHRVRLVCQENAGVAAARNAGAAASNAPILAFVDADDLWAPEKVELQCQALVRAGGAPVLVYCWYAQIDGRGRLLWPSDAVVIEGPVLKALCERNFVGNGSSMLMPRTIFEAVGGFDSSLREAGAQGCEDLMFLLEVAEQFEFRCVPRHLVGYRRTPDNMSSDVFQMVRSCELVLGRARARHPELTEEVAVHFSALLAWMCRRAVLGGRVVAAAKLLRRLRELDAERASSLMPELAQLYLVARIVPDWVKAGAQPILACLKRRRPAYLELSW